MLHELATTAADHCGVEINLETIHMSVSSTSFKYTNIRVICPYCQIGDTYLYIYLINNIHTKTRTTSVETWTTCAYGTQLNEFQTCQPGNTLLQDKIKGFARFFSFLQDTLAPDLHDPLKRAEIVLNLLPVSAKP